MGKSSGRKYTKLLQQVYISSKNACEAKRNCYARKHDTMLAEHLCGPHHSQKHLTPQRLDQHAPVEYKPTTNATGILPSYNKTCKSSSNVYTLSSVFKQVILKNNHQCRHTHSTLSKLQERNSIILSQRQYKKICKIKLKNIYPKNLLFLTAIYTCTLHKH
jgi:hypothetical protein